MKHDAQGFLLGERISTPQSGAPAGLSILGAVRRDVAVIRRLLETRAVRPTARNSNSPSSDRASAAQPVAPSVNARRSTATGRMLEPVQARGPAAVPVMRDARGRFVRAAELVASPERGQGRAAVGPSGFASSKAAQSRDAAESDRDTRGRFVGGGSGSSDFAGENIMGRIAGSLDSLSDMVQGAENIDPTIAALKEVRDVVSPVGRGVMALHNRMTERKKERWYSRILKAITGRKGDQVATGGDVTRGSFLGTFSGELMGNAARLLPAILAGAGGLLLKGLGLLGAFGVGQYIGGKISDWLDKSSISTKIIDAFIAVEEWFREKIADPVKNNVVKPVAEAMGRTQKDVTQRNESRVSTGMLHQWDRAKKNLSGAARMAGVDPGIVAKVAAFESGFDPNARPKRKDGSLMSSAHGYGQFIDSTWISTMRKYGGKYGVGGAADLSSQQALALRGDPKLQAAMLAELTRENVDLGRKLGGSNDDANVYALHNLGTGDGSRFLKALTTNPGSSVASVLSGKVISNNKSLYADGSISVAEAYRRMGSKMAAGNQFAAELAATVSPSIAAASVPAVSAATLPAIKPPTVPMSVPDRPTTVQPAAVPERLSGGANSQPIVISKEDVGQDVKNRKVAHIVTGGIGG